MKIKNINHLGIIAGVIDELEIVTKINEILGVDKRENITAGQIVKAMILNGLGMVSKPRGKTTTKQDRPRQIAPVFLLIK